MRAHIGFKFGKSRIGERGRDEMETERKCRAHHIICTALYEGKGYSGAFCENMTAVVTRLRENPDERLRLVAQPDLICADCPNHGADDDCTQDQNRVVNKDRRVIAMFDLEENGIYTYRRLCEAALAAMTPELFMETCGTCEWRAQGLCRYEDLIAQLSETVQPAARG